MENTLDVPQGSSPAASEDVQTQPEVAGSPGTPPVTPTPPVGSQTPPENLYAALAEERRLRKEAEDKLNNLTVPAPSEDEIFSDEGKALKKQLDSVKEQLAHSEEERELERVYAQFPDVKGMSAEFDEFRKDYPRHKLENVAKIFRAEKGLLEGNRKGLERATGGPRTPVTSGMTSDEVADLRKNNFRKYQELLMQGKINV